MARIGLFYDVHHPKNEAAYQSDADYLLNTLGSDMLVFGGDQINGNEPAVPHSPDADLRAFWDNIEAAIGSSGLDKTYAIPGNHDIPVYQHEKIAREYIGERGVTPQVIQPVSGVTVILLDTNGARMQGGNHGAGHLYNYIPYRNLEFLREELSNAHSRGDAVLVCGHAPFLFGDDPNLLSYNPDGPWGGEADAVLKSYADDNGAYEIVQNHLNAYQYFADGSPVVYVSGHDNHNSDLNGSAELYTNDSEIYHVWQDHYSTGVNAPHSFLYADINESTGNVKIVSVNSADKTETTIMDVTPSW